MGGTHLESRADEAVALGSAVHLKGDFPGFIQLAINGQIQQAIPLGGDTVERNHLDIDRAEDAQPG